MLTNSDEKILQSGVVDVGFSDHQFIYCTRKVTQLKFNTHKYIKTRPFKNYTKDLFSKELDKIKFPDYSKFTDINSAYSDFAGRLISH